jgi:hypothetical protein
MRSEKPKKAEKNKAKGSKPARGDNPNTRGTNYNPDNSDNRLTKPA